MRPRLPHLDAQALFSARTGPSRTDGTVKGGSQQKKGLSAKSTGRASGFATWRAGVVRGSWKLQQHGFTIVEICVVIVIMSTLAILTYTIGVPRWRERTYYTRMVSEMNTVGHGMTLYAAKYNDYPADVSRDIPGGVKEFLQGQYDDDWPDAPYPDSVYDYDNWPPDSNGPQQTYQISMRMCDAGQDAACKANAKKYLNNFIPTSTLNSWDSYSSVYYCIKGSCRSHQNKPLNHPGYCINCGNKAQFY